MYQYFKHLTLNSAYRLGIFRNLAHRFDYSRVNSLYVLVYHRVDWPNAQPRLDPRNLSATPEQFEQHMHSISVDYNPVSAEMVLEAVLNNKSLPPRAVLVTVDDGYCDFKEYIWPIAKNYGIRPVLFVPTAYVGKGVFWWDQLYDALRRTTRDHVETPLGVHSLHTDLERQSAFEQIAKYMKRSPFNTAFAMLEDLCRNLVPNPFAGEKITMDWDELRELAKAGVSIAPHTHTHPSMGNIDPEQVRSEISESQHLMLKEISSTSPLFAYPYGLPGTIGETAGEILRETDCVLAFTMIPGRARLDNDDHMYLPRIETNPQLTVAQLHARLTPFYDIFKRWQRM
jgi:peptidoglycan/xylan/chitin deacetylase (PgdA/CDA1 family)